MITQDKLTEGDILLYSDKHPMAYLIQKFDIGDYYHASLYIGNGEVIEARKEGVKIRPLAESIDGIDKIIVKRLNSKVTDFSIVIETAKTYLDKRYGFEQIVLLAIIMLIRPHRHNNVFYKILNKVLEKASLSLLSKTNGDKNAIICSELVYRAYDEALPEVNDPYTIHLRRSFNGYEKSSIINNDSLISKFYGTNSFINTTSAFVEKHNIEHIYNKINTSNNIIVDAENSLDSIKDLHNEYIEMSVNNNHFISKDETVKLKSNLDRFLTSYYYSKNGGTHNKALSGDILSFFIRDNANFVTPGDLQFAVNLTKGFELQR